MTVLHAALESLVPYHAWVPLDLCSTLHSAYKYPQLKLLLTLRDHTIAPFLYADDCSDYARCRSSYDRTQLYL
jgi:hypothetical protein